MGNLQANQPNFDSATHFQNEQAALTRNRNRAIAGEPDQVAEICRDSVSCLSRLHAENGNWSAFGSKTEPTLVAFGEEANSAVFGDTETYHIVGPPGPRGSAHRGFQQGLLGLNGPQHIRHRRLLMPAMSKRRVVNQARLMSEIVATHLDRWQYGKTYDLYGEMKSLSIQIAAQLLFGLDRIPDAECVAADFQDWLDAYISILLEMLLPTSAPSGAYQQMLDAAQQLEIHFHKIIDARRATLQPDADDLLGVLLNAQEAGKISDVELVGELHTLLNASYQTTASALTWTLLMIATHGDVANDLRREILAGDENRSLSLTDCVIKESLRILPPVVFTARRVTRKTMLGGTPLAAGSYVVVSMYVTHRQEDIFAQPNSFQPDRWQSCNPTPYEYLPYAAGPRMCMGAAFANQLFRIAVPAVMRRFHLAIEPGTVVDRHSNLTLGVAGSLPITALPPDQPAQSVALNGNVRDMVDFPESATRRAA